jgi:class 3 adenylate cyclase
VPASSGTVVAAELRGFIALAEPIDPEQVAAVLDAYYRTFAQSASANGASLVTFRGPTALAAWESADGPEVGALAAAHTAWLLTDAQLAAMPASLPRLPHHLRFGIGIATGPLFIGPLGPDPGRHDIVGDIVNAAILLAAAASAGEILITRATRDALGDQVRVSETEPLLLREKRTKVETYLLHAAEGR